MTRLTGAVINVYSEKTLAIEGGSRGVCAMAVESDWYDEGKMTVFSSGEDCEKLFAHGIDEMTELREMMKRASRAYIWPLNVGGKAAHGMIGENITVTAAKAGSRGNSIAVSCEKYGEMWQIKTFLDGNVMDSQTVESAADFSENGWVKLSGEGELAAATTALSEGEDGSVKENAWDRFLAALEFLKFNVIAYTGSDISVKAKIAQFVKRQREEDRFIQVCMGDYSADSEGVISFCNGVVLSDGTRLDENGVSAWLAGATAAAEVFESLTYDSYDGAVSVNGELTRSEQLEKKKQGLGCFIMNNDRVKVESDINTLVSFNARKQSDFSKNRVIRVLDGICSDIKAVFDSSFAGAESNSNDGRNRFKASVCDYLTALEQKEAIEDFSSDDVTVSAGADKDTVIVSMRVKPVDSMEKADITVRVR